jgi:hypothetical protein
LSTLTNLTIQVNGKRGSALTKPEDFLIEWDFTKPKEVKQQSIEEMKEVLKAIASANKKQEKRMVRKPKKE